MKGYEGYAGAFKALSDETRLKIFLILTNGEKCACRLHECFDCTQPTISYHMRVLTESGLVESRRDGTNTCYRVRPQVADAVKAMLDVLPGGYGKDQTNDE